MSTYEDKTVTVGGVLLTLPQGLQRLDSDGHCGWQARLDDWTKYRADEDETTEGSLKSLVSVTKTLTEKLAEDPPSSIRENESPRKEHKLPVGITFVTRRRRDRPDEIYYVVHAPVFNGRARNRKVYAGNANTLTQASQASALAKAVALRATAVEDYKYFEILHKRKLRRERTALLRQFIREQNTRIKTLKG